MRLVGTTRSTLQSIRDRTHWNFAALQPLDPVTLGLCRQIDLDTEIQRAARERPHQVLTDQGPTLMPAEVTTAPTSFSAEDVFGPGSSSSAAEKEEIPDIHSVFSRTP
jgi:hypothetical protein